jgi:hypothetical protein
VNSKQMLDEVIISVGFHQMPVYPKLWKKKQAIIKVGYEIILSKSNI